MSEEQRERFALGQRKEKNGQKYSIQKYEFLSEQFIFCKQFALITNIALFKEQRERMAHGCFFAKMSYFEHDKQRVNEQMSEWVYEQRANERMSKRANERMSKRANYQP